MGLIIIIITIEHPIIFGISFSLNEEKKDINSELSNIVYNNLIQRINKSEKKMLNYMRKELQF